VTGHLNSQRRIGRNDVWYRRGDAINAVLAATNRNFGGLLAY
jgi:IS5 family transposase